MRTRSFYWIAIAGIFMIMFTVGCGAEKDAAERRNYMIPKKSEMARNSRYKEVEKRKTNKVKHNKSKRKSLF
jgi:hypothetical protein